MAPLTLLLLLFSLLILPFSLSQTLEYPPSVLLPVTKHGPTGQYLARISPVSPAQLVLDLAGPFLWTDCSTTSHRPTALSCRSIQCSAANAAPCPLPATTSPPPCSLPVKNPVTGESAAGELVQDTVVAVGHEFVMSCAPSILLKGLAGGARGVLGLGRSRIGAPEQISHSFGYPKRFSLCLSSSNGMVFSGHGFDSDVSNSLIYTPLLNGEDYSINLKGIQIQNKRLSLGLENNKMGRVKISTISPFSTMEAGIYRVFLRAFTMAAESLNLTSVPPVEPFGSCFGSSGSVPVIDLVLQSEMVKWRIDGHNLMVKVRDNVMCLGFMNGGENMGASIVLGGHQIEDNLLEFDLGRSMLGFSSSLIMKKTSCSQLTSSSSSSSMHKDLQSL